MNLSENILVIERVPVHGDQSFTGLRSSLFRGQIWALSLYLPFMFVVISMAISLPAFAQIWDIQVVDSVSALYTSLVLDSLDYPHISYLDYSNDNLRYAYWNGSSWVIERVDSVGNVGRGSCLKLDRLCRPHISYMDRTNGYLKYAFKDGGWTIEIVDSTALGWWTSIALDSLAYPHIAYCDDSTNSLKYTSWNGLNWEIDIVDTVATESDTGGYFWYISASLALDSVDCPHISYRDNIIGVIKYAYWDGGWNIDTVDAGSFPSLVLDKDGFPHIAYGWKTIKYAVWNGLGWDIDTVIGGYQPSLCLDKQGYPQIGYWYMDGSEYIVACAVWNEEFVQWIIVDVDTSPDRAYVSLSIDSLRYPHISYHRGLSYARAIPDVYLYIIQLFPPVIDKVYTDSTYQVEVGVGNEGLITESFKAECSITDSNGVVVYLDTIETFTPVPPGVVLCLHYDDWTVPSYDSMEYKIVAVTLLPYDGNPSNDTLVKTVFAYNPVGVEETSISSLAPKVLNLFQNQPNPFFTFTTVTYALPASTVPDQQSEVNLSIYDITGRLVRTLVNKKQKSGYYKIRWDGKNEDGKNLPSGIYFYQLKTREDTITKKMILLKE